MHTDRQTDTDTYNSITLTSKPPTLLIINHSEPHYNDAENKQLIYIDTASSFNKGRLRYAYSKLYMVKLHTRQK